MSALRTGFTYLLRNATTTGQFLIRNSIGLVTQQGRLEHINAASAIMQKRSIHQFQIQDNLTYYTKQDGFDIKVDPNTMKIIDPVERRLCIMLCWLGSKPKNIMKYAAIPLSQGFDVMTVRLPIFQTLFPERGSKQTAENLLKFMEVNENFNASFLYAFSVGACLWAEVLALVEKDLDRYKPVLNRLNAQVWDSMVDAHEFGLGVSRAAFPKNEFLRSLTRKYITLHQWVFYQSSWRHYLAASKQFHRNHCHSPTLLLCSKADVVGSLESNFNFTNSWKQSGTMVDVTVFENSAHVQHFLTYPKEYLIAMRDFLEKYELLFDKPAMEQEIEKAINKSRKNSNVSEFGTEKKLII